jgi:hypothetical protein
MTYTSELIRNGDKRQIWEKFCGFLDLSLPDYMQIQERLLMEQINTLAGSNLGNHFLGKHPPKSMDEFRKVGPLTKYGAYVDFLMDCKEDDLPKANYRWARTSGKSGEYPCKWVPYTDEMFRKVGEVVLTAMIFASCSQKGEVSVETGDIILLATAPRPYFSSYVSLATDDLLDVRFIPPLEEAETMEFGQRLAAGFSLGMETGIDYFYGLASILTKMGERFESGGSSGKFSLKMLKPKILARYIKGMAKAKLNKRNVLPKDLWKLKGIMTGGMDTDIYKDRVAYYWGMTPLEGVGCTEGGNMTCQAWNRKGMTFAPDINFYEFIPFAEHEKAKKDPSYTPKTVLMDELNPGIYEIVMTNLYGGAMFRYRIGDLYEVVSMGDEEIGTELPQFRFFSRCDDYMDLGNMVRFTEKTIWMALEESGIRYVDWAARKEVENSQTYLHIYLELKENEKVNTDELKTSAIEGLNVVNPEFGSMEEIMGDGHVKISVLPKGAFDNYIEAQRKAGADLAHIKPPHMEPTDDVIKKLSTPR